MISLNRTLHGIGYVYNVLCSSSVFSERALNSRYRKLGCIFSIIKSYFFTIEKFRKVFLVGIKDSKKQYIKRTTTDARKNCSADFCLDAAPWETADGDRQAGPLYYSSGVQLRAASGFGLEIDLIA